jgi:hypothetical protein
MSDQRLTNLETWLSTQVLHESFIVKKLAGDASFRRYFRVELENRSLIAMDAPPEKENCQPFITIAEAFRQAGVRVPSIHAINLEQGYLLLNDFGDNLYLNLLNANNVDALYKKALDVLPTIQASTEFIGSALPHFGQTCVPRELALFADWFLKRHLNLTITPTLQKTLQKTYALLLDVINTQPQTCVHRDFHSRNLLELSDNQVGVLDFQDAVIGPISYDAVSLLRDCYIAWPLTQVEEWARYYYQRLCEHHTFTSYSFDEFLYGFDLVGIQRHLKVLGIFSRLGHCYGKPSYLSDIPRTAHYVIEVSEKYAELKELNSLFKSINIA